MKRIIAMLFAVCLCLTMTASVSYAETWEEVYEDNDGITFVDVDSARKSKAGGYKAWVKYVSTQYGSVYIKQYRFREGSKDALEVGAYKTLMSKAENGVLSAPSGVEPTMKLSASARNHMAYVLAYLNQRFGDKSIKAPEMKWYYSSDRATYTYNVNSIVEKEGNYYVWVQVHYPFAEHELYAYTDIGYEFCPGEKVMYRMPRFNPRGRMSSPSMTWQFLEDNVAVKHLYEVVVAELAVREK